MHDCMYTVTLDGFCLGRSTMPFVNILEGKFLAIRDKVFNLPALYGTADSTLKLGFSGIYDRQWSGVLNLFLLPLVSIILFVCPWCWP